MKGNKNTSRLPKIKPAHMSGMVSINPNGYWSLGEFSCNDNSKNHR